MKKFLLMFILGFSFTNSIFAADGEEIDFKTKGFLNYFVAAQGGQDDAYDDSYNSFDIMGDGEIQFVGEKQLDKNSLAGFQVDLETHFKGSDDVTDEVFVYYQNNYGRIEAGLTKSVAEKAHVGAPFVGNIDLDESFAFSFIENPGVEISSSTALNSDQEINKISYITPPRQSGFQFSAGYIPGNGMSGSEGLHHEDFTLKKEDSFDSAYVSSLKYKQTFGALSLTVSSAAAEYKDVVYDTATNLKGNQTEGSFGINLSYRGFVIGGAYKDIKADEVLTPGASAGVAKLNSKSYSFGAAYEFGPIMTSLSYLGSKVEAGTEDDAMNLYVLSGRYFMSKSTSLAASIGYLDLDDGETGGVSNEGYFGTFGMSFKF